MGQGPTKKAPICQRFIIAIQTGMPLEYPAMKQLNSLCFTLGLLLAGCDMAPDTSLVKVASEPAEGLTQSALDQSYLDTLVRETRTAAETRLQQAYEKNRVPPDQRFSHAVASGRYEWFGETQLAVVDLSYSANPMRVTQVVGLINDTQVTVSCISPEGAPLALNGGEGECAQVIAREFELE